MKVIDLLNKMANEEELPNKIKHFTGEYIYDFDKKDYFKTESLGLINWVMLPDSAGKLNDEIEIIEEDKKIELPEKIENIDIFYGGISSEIITKLNELIDYLKNKEEEKEK